jgi:hypothetical protein
VCWWSFLTAHAALIDRIEDDLAELLPLSWYDVLLALYEAPEHRLRMHELVSAILVTRGGLTRLVGLDGAPCYCRSSASRSIPRGVGF